MLLIHLPISAATIEKGAHISDDVWEAVLPYLMPDNHPIKEKLDAIFQNSERVTESRNSLHKAGFKLAPVQGAVCTAMKHKKIKGYVFKIYTDDQNTRVDWQSWTKRAKGASVLRSTIDYYGYKRLFKVPQKWIYPLPEKPDPQYLMEGGRKNFILVAEDMHPIGRKDNWDKWKSVNNKDLLKKLFTIIAVTGAGDCVRANNIPWCKDGKIAFVDTEVIYRWPVIFHPFLEVMNKPMRIKVEKIIQDLGGKNYRIEEEKALSLKR